ncbi:hypothetical protein HKCCE2091_15015 [Rhodobacterales bacterium HKCCE2091]|nr:hypothetical protein [Rhodobacterales bacterium HKCCE2091]
MRLNEVSYGDGVPLDGYGPGFFRIGGERRDGAVLVLPGSVAPWGGYDDTAPLLAAAGRIDVLLVGTGPEIAQIPTALREALEASGIGVEIMATGPACRTYNVLLGEGRRIGAALLPA